MHQHERHNLIVSRARAATRIEVSALAEEMDVTPETVRRDLTVLERRGLVRRVHGGAVAVERLGFEPTLDVRSGHRAADKQRIAQAALAFVPEAGTILLDAGTTTIGVAEGLPREGELNVLTNSLPVAAVIARRPDLSLFVLGGRVRSRTQATIGSWGLGPLRDVHIDVAFIGTNGLSLTAGLTTPDQAEAATKQAMMAAAAQVVVLADSSKVGAAHFAKFGSLADIDVLITDSGIDPEVLDEIRATGPEVVLT
ncbi:MAG: DeoR/GlpR family DNA-binding transcription regulator [Actinobacteria bacterium]|nr:DeoR/GlpR family DNA-binding transcription regulator [Actinomycetota bacterium]